MTDDELERIRGLPIESVAERNGLNVIRHKSLCPFHDDHHASLSFRYNKYKCYACGAHGDGISLTMHMQNLKFADACRWLANESNIILTEYKPQPKSEPVMKPFPKDFYQAVIDTAVLGVYAEDFLFDDRKLDPEIIRSLHIGAINNSGAWFNFYWSKHYTKEQLRSFGVIVGEGNYERCFFDCPCLLFPYYSVDSQLVGIQSRYIGDRIVCNSEVMRAQLERDKRYAKRFRFTQGSKPCIYNQPVLKNLLPDEELWIAEGITDCLALLSSGKKAIAIPSATLLTYTNKQLLAYPKAHGWNGSFHIYPDQDEAGERLYNELLKTATELGVTLVRHTLPEGCKDFADYWKNNH